MSSPDFIRTGHSGRGRKIICLHRLSILADDLPFCFFHGSGRSLLRRYVLINLAAHTVINIRTILRKPSLLHLFPCIGPRTDRLCFESFHLIGRRHFTRNNSFEIFLQRKDIDQQKSLFTRSDLHSPTVYRHTALSVDRWNANAVFLLRD